jgi:hypothetical protein
MQAGEGEVADKGTRCVRLVKRVSTRFVSMVSVDDRSSCFHLDVPINPELDAARACTKQRLEDHCQGSFPTMHTSVEETDRGCDLPAYGKYALHFWSEICSLLTSTVLSQPASNTDHPYYTAHSSPAS